MLDKNPETRITVPEIKVNWTSILQPFVSADFLFLWHLLMSQGHSWCLFWELFLANCLEKAARSFYGVTVLSLLLAWGILTKALLFTYLN